MSETRGWRISEVGWWAIAVTLMNLIVDIVYAYLDPRVRYT